MSNDQLLLNELKSINKRLDNLEKTTVKKTDLKSFIDLLVPVIDKRVEMSELFTKAEIRGAKEELKEELQEEIRATDKHLHSEIKNTKEDLQIEILASRAAAHEDITKFVSGLWKKEREQDIRLDALDEHTGHHNPIKH